MDSSLNVEKLSWFEVVLLKAFSGKIEVRILKNIVISPGYNYAFCRTTLFFPCLSLVCGYCSFPFSAVGRFLPLHVEPSGEEN